MLRQVFGKPRGPIRYVTWCAVSGFCDQKSHCMVLSRSPVSGRRFCERMKCGNFLGSRTKKIGVVFPTRSKLPSEVENFRAKPRTSRQAPGEPSSPATVEYGASLALFTA